MKNNIDSIIEALFIINNEALQLRDKIKSNKANNAELKNRQAYLYSLKNKVVNKLYGQGLICTVGYYSQDNNNKSNNKVFVNKIDGNDTEIHSLKPYKRKGYDINKLGDIGLIEYKELDSKISTDEAIIMLNKYIKVDNDKNNKPKQNIKQNKQPLKPEKIDVKIKETKLVELSKLRVVRDIHINCWLNPQTTIIKKAELIELISKNNGSYPKSDAILVRKSKDPEDKRRVVYNIEDGYRRYELAGELGLDKVYVDIIEE